MRDPRRPANGTSRSRHCWPVSTDRSTARSTDSLSRVPRLVTLPDAQTNAAASELRSAAARHQSASLNKSGLGRRPSLKPPSRATRRRPRSELARPAACLNIRPNSRTVFTQFDRSSPSRSRIGARLSGIAPHSPKLRCVGRTRSPERTHARPNRAARIAVALFPLGRDERRVSAFPLYDALDT